MYQEVVVNIEQTVDTTVLVADFKMLFVLYKYVHSLFFVIPDYNTL